MWQVISRFRFGLSWLALLTHLWSASGLGLAVFLMIMVTTGPSGASLNMVFHPPSWFTWVLDSKSTNEQVPMYKHFPSLCLCQVCYLTKVTFKVVSFLLLMGGTTKAHCKGYGYREGHNLWYFWQSAHHSCTLKSIGFYSYIRRPVTSEALEWVVAQWVFFSLILRCLGFFLFLFWFFWSMI